MPGKLLGRGTSQSEGDLGVGANKQRVGSGRNSPIKPCRKVTFASPPESESESTEQGDGSILSPEDNDSDEAPCTSMDAGTIELNTECQADTEAIKVLYSQIGLEENPQTVVLRANVYNSIPPRLSVKPEAWKAFEDTLSFSATPQLPEGFSMNPRTGTITGMASNARKEKTHHEISINVPAYAPGGISLGTWPVTRCSIVMQILD